MNIVQNIKPVKKTKSIKFGSLIIYPIGFVKIWNSPFPLPLTIGYSVLYLPIFLFLCLFLFALACAALLPPLDLTVGPRTDRTLYNPGGNYSVTFIKTGAETHGSYEAIQVDLEPLGGNGWHYHKTFDEMFTVMDGRIEIGLEGEKTILTKGESVTASKNKMHYFKNPDNSPSVLLVKTMPARGLEKTLRIAYGLDNDGLMKEGLPLNPWHTALLMGYSESYFSGIPSIIQEPLANGFSRLAQALGKDKELEKYYR
jgi:quercetin dioxygenase-like cupin family protein